MENNEVFLQGIIETQPLLSHEVKGRGFFGFDLMVQRLSEAVDILPIIVPEDLMTERFEMGSEISIKGEFRSRNVFDGSKNKLELSVLVGGVVEDGENLKSSNSITLNGYICKNPIYRVTPLGRGICEILLAVHRRNGKSDYIPCILWGENALIVKDFKVGEEIRVSGRVQSRNYVKKVEQGEISKIAYEVSVNKILKKE